MREEERLGDGKRRGQQPFLMDEADARRMPPGRAGRRAGTAAARRERHAADRDLAFVRRVQARQKLDERRLARAVLADQPMHGAARYRERRAAQRGDAAEALDDAPHVERERRAGACHDERRHGVRAHFVEQVEERDLLRMPRPS
ncbi:aBC transporter, carbohydrate uptake transporter-2 (CUT2) family, ATP-binding protein [Burkholderia mallei]|nr:aBC transporter, carbohydrate uptake transporter-2 (CUT2) family, ATP-binding protein [Burkholderia mallei]